jgi:glycerol uptake facilitator-like aquaporin
MDRNRTMTEFVGSLAVVFFAVGMGDVLGEYTGLSQVVSVIAAGLVLAIFMIAMGGTILPMFTLAKMASGRDEIEDGMNDFIAQMFGGIVAYALAWWQSSADTSMTWGGLPELGPYTAVASLFGGFLLMMVYDRQGGGWEVGILAGIVGLAGVSITGAGDFGGMLVDSAWEMSNMLAVFGGMIASAVGAYLAIMFGEQLLNEEE